jgi:hypothetical protein
VCSNYLEVPIRWLLIIFAILMAAIAVELARAGSGYGPMPKHWSARRSTPVGWYAGALCIHAHESGNWHIYNRPYANGFQFMLGTWISAGGRPSTWVSASPKEQLYRAFVVWKRDGASWREWPNTSRACGLR